MPRFFIRKIVLFACLAPVLALALQAILVRGLLKYDTSARGIWNQVIRGDVNAEILICGSSRAQTHYDAQIITTGTGRSAFNIGRNGTHVDLQVGFLKSYLAHNRAPVCIVQNIDVFCFLTSKRVYEPGQYIPYLNEPDLFQRLVSIDPSYARMRAFPLLGIIEYRLFLTAAGGLLGITEKEDHFYGYKPEDLVWTGDFEKYKAKNPNGVVMSVQPEGVQVFRELIEICSKANIKLILVYSPEYREGQKLFNNRAEVLGRVREMATTAGAEFWDYSEDSICLDRSLFYNSQHMNRKGATLFTEKLVPRLKRALESASTQALSPIRGETSGGP